MSKRVIKFRAWYDNRMIKESFCEYLSGYGCMFDQFTRPDAIMQFTGLHDKNGVEVYEGDVLYHKIQGKRQVIYPMHDRIAAFGLASADGKLNTLQDSEFLYEVIGNIYENPELLEE